MFLMAFVQPVLAGTNTRGGFKLEFNNTLEEADPKTGKLIPETQTLHSGPSISFLNSSTLDFRSPDPEEFIEVTVSMKDQYHALALKTLVQEKRIMCLPLVPHQEHFVGTVYNILDVRGGSCRARDILKLIDQRAGHYRRADESKGHYKVDRTGFLDVLGDGLKSLESGISILFTKARVSDERSKTLSERSNAQTRIVSTSKASGAR